MKRTCYDRDKRYTEEQNRKAADNGSETNPTLLNLNTVEKGERLSNSNSGLLIMMLTAHDNTKLKVIY